MKKIPFRSIAAVLLAGSLLAACEKEETGGGSQGRLPGKGNYIVSASAGSATGAANYLLRAESLDEGNVTTQGYGLETATGTAWLFYGDEYLYRLQYNQGSQGVTTSYCMSDDVLTTRPKEYNITRFTTYGIYGDNIVTVSAVDTDTKDEAGNIAKGLGITYLHAAAETTSTKTVAGENFLGIHGGDDTGEYVTLAGILEANGKLYTAVVPMGLSKYGVKAENGRWVKYPELVKTEDGGSGSGSYEKGELQGTQYPNEAWVAIYDDDTFTSPTLVKTERISYACGRNRSQYYQTIWAADNGDVYVFSPGYAKSMEADVQKTTLNSGVVRINAGESEFDENYYFDIETASGGQPLYRCWHVTEDYFLFQMYTQGLNGKGQGTTKMAVYKGRSKEFRYVTGLPDASVISSFGIGATPYCENGCAYVGVVTTDGAKPAIYRIDAKTARATRGLTVDAESISAVGRLE